MGCSSSRLSPTEVSVPTRKGIELTSIEGGIHLPELDQELEQSNDTIASQKFYLPGIDHTQAEKILLQPSIDNYTFLIRDSSEIGNYSISVRNGDAVNHFMIVHEGEKFYLETVHKFSTLEKLVSYYSKNKYKAIAFLKKSLIKEDLQGGSNIPIIHTESMLSLSLTSSKQTITPPRKNTKLDLLCTISSYEGTRDHIPLSICVVIDVSYSMNKHMEVMKSTLNGLLDQLKPCDRLSIVTFSDNAEVKLKLTATDHLGKSTAANVISKLDVDDMTNIEDGINKAIDEFTKVDSSNATPTESILLFTDGNANAGCTNYSTIRGNTADAFNKIRFLDRQLTLSVIAYGTKPSVELKSLSDACDGLYFPIHLSGSSNTMEDLPVAFARIYGFCSTVAANNIHLNFVASSQVQLCPPQSLPSNYKLISNGPNCTISIPFIPAGNNIDILLPIQFTEDLSDEVQCKELATVTMTAHSLVTMNKVRLEAKGKVSIDKNYSGATTFTQEEQNAYVQLLRSEVIKTLIAVEQAAMKRKLEDARNLVKDMLVTLIQSSLPNIELVNCLIETLLVVHGDLESPKKYDQIGCKRLQQLKQAHTQQRNNIAGDIVIPNSKKSLGKLVLNQKLRETLDFTVYDGKVIKTIEERFSNSLRRQYRKPVNK